MAIKKQIEEDDSFEEFPDDTEEEEESEEEEEPAPIRKPINSKPPIIRAPVRTEQRQMPVKQAELPKPEPQYVAVPRLVPIETMINELYDGQQEIRQILLSILEKLK